ncbi:TIGR03943 family putative permease subunit [Neobacillus vireti]|uniref:TIGR03943 family protein n=1 Tax=Neobacillus vireti LMG 21834 TaxID=1131730 RepID=A0AB94IFL4_9BACI|nr:TIGR03943 family protein [Neobacillus vireti]ETI65902.1 hypothetical protein BAVI_25384 [Neobacillus vireti LMG 21834]KLT17735.1 hypothetical protein AA980_11540 [Neobacillus vireti]
MKQEQRKINHVMVRGIVLLGFTSLLLKLVITGDLKYFIAPKVAPLTYFSIAAFLLMGIAQFWRNKSGDDVDCDCGSDHGTSDSDNKSIIIYSMFIIPILTGMFFSNNTLDSAVAANRGVHFGEKTKSVNNQPDTQKKTITESEAQESTTSNGSVTDQFANWSQESDVEEKNLLSSEKIIVTDENFIYTMDKIMQKLDLFVGKEIEFVGFVYRPEGFPDDQIIVSRFGVACCIADSDIVGMLSIGDVSGFQQDEWVKVNGTIDKFTYQEIGLPSVKIKSIEKVPKLDDPYVYY